MEGEKRGWWAIGAMAAPVVLLIGYVAAYFATAQSVPTPVDPAKPLAWYNRTEVHCIPFGGDDLWRRFFWPINQIDRSWREEAWCEDNDWF